MLPVERQAYIRSQIVKKENMKISELSEQLKVSEMTIHRDIKPLIDEGFVVKSFGGISLAGSGPTTCIYCRKNLNEKIACQLILENDDVEMACCPHCGLLRFDQIQSKVKQVICYDFFRQTTLNAKNAYYVTNTSIDLGCCQPQLITFEREKHARQFVKGFDGDVNTFSEALEITVKTMK